MMLLLSDDVIPTSRSSKGRQTVFSSLKRAIGFWRVPITNTKKTPLLKEKDRNLEEKIKVDVGQTFDSPVATSERKFSHLQGYVYFSQIFTLEN